MEKSLEKKDMLSSCEIIDNNSELIINETEDDSHVDWQDIKTSESFDWFGWFRDLSYDEHLKRPRKQQPEWLEKPYLDSEFL